MESKKYPVNSFPPVMRDLIIELCNDAQVPVELAASVVLAAASMACQSSYEIQLPDGSTKPCSLYLLTIADSGERKSSIYSSVMKPFYEFEKKEKIAHNLLSQDIKAEQQAHKILIKSIEKTIKKKMDNGIECQRDIEKYKELIKNTPSIPKKIKLIYDDVTPEAVQKGLYDNVPSAGIISDEATTFFEGRAKNNLGLFNKLWDGSSFDVERRGGNSFSVENGKFAMLLMIQPDAFIRYFERHGTHACGTGFLPRFLITKVISTQGQRKSRTPSQREGLNAFHKAIEELLKQSKEVFYNNAQPIKLALDIETKLELPAIMERIEESIRENKHIFSMSNSYLSKYVENTIRIAALLHVLSGDKSELIKLHEFNKADEIMAYFYSQTKNLFTTYFGTPTNDADYLYSWLCNLRNPHTLCPIISLRKSMVRRIAPNHLRDNKRINEALNILQEDGKVRLENYKNPNGSITVMVNILK